MLEVVAALVRRDDEFLICRRPMHKARGGQWEFAGGKVEKGESRQQAIVREIQEELNLTLDAGAVIAETVHAYPDVTVHLSLLETSILQGNLHQNEHSEIAWVTLRDIHKYDLCPADRALVRQLLKREWLREESIAHIHGWDFSHIDGRYSEEEDLPWSYREEILRHLRGEHHLLDIDTGGGEFLLGLGHPLANIAATENYPPNIDLCRQKLPPLGVDFRPGSADALPFAEDSFDMVINRHGDFCPAEIHRVLKPSGIFITQQVGGENDRELVQLLLPGAQPPYPENHLTAAVEKFRRAGFAILRAEEAFRPIRFYDVGALVWFARIIEWEFPGFSVETCLNRLYAAQDMLQAQGYIEGKIHRFLLVARKG